MESNHEISAHWLNLSRIEEIINNDIKLELSQESIHRINNCRKYLDDKVAGQDEPIYGVTTGFGSLCKHSISNEDLEKLQVNLVQSHACGFGDEVSKSIIKLMLLLKVQSLSYGNSGVQLVTVQRLVDFFNNDVYPVVYEQGSLGASGDLCPLAHLSLPLLGQGTVQFKNQKMDGSLLKIYFNWDPIELKSKEGLALLNGTQFMGANGIYALMKARKLSVWADLIGALSLEAFDGRIEPFLPQVHKVRNQYGQIETAEFMLKVLKGSRIIERNKEHVQDPYSFRCIPQVHGATKDAIRYVQSVFENEANAVTDNPTIFPEYDLIVSAGNFHGQPLALALDFLSIAMAELGSISERRIYRLISGARKLPDFLVANPGLNSGFMIPQYTAAAIASQNKQLCTPCSVDTIESSQGQEDHVSMGANAALKTIRVIDNVERILAIELFNACQAIEFQRPAKSSKILEELIESFRKVVPFIENDTLMYVEMQKALQFIQKNNPEKYVD